MVGYGLENKACWSVIKTDCQRLDNYSGKSGKFDFTKIRRRTSECYLTLTLFMGWVTFADDARNAFALDNLAMDTAFLN